MAQRGCREGAEWVQSGCRGLDAEWEHMSCREGAEWMQSGCRVGAEWVQRLGAEVSQPHVRGWAVAGPWLASEPAVTGVWQGCGRPLRPFFSPQRHRCETTKPATEGSANGEAPRPFVILTTQTTSSQACCLIASVRVSTISRTAHARVWGAATDLGGGARTVHSVSGRGAWCRLQVNTRIWACGAHRPRETLGR